MKDRLTVSLLSFIAGALAILLARSLFAPTPANAQLPPTSAQGGRYMAVTASASGTYGLYIVDTQTSHTWLNQGNWTDLGMPAAAAPGAIKRH